MRLLLRIVLPCLLLSFDLYAEDRLQRSLEVLNQLKTGQNLLKGALRAWGLTDYRELRRYLRWGEASRTDTTLVRKFHPDSGREEKERRVLIYLKENHPESDLILDLSHELVHATSRALFDPYDSRLTPGKYIWSAIEGGGGEVEAVLTECKIAIELALFSHSPLERCKRYVDLTGKTPQHLDRNKVRGDFYRVGNWHSNVKSQLGSEVSLFPLLSQEAPTLYSSTGRAPYPFALLKEFDEMTQIACQNSKKRMEDLRGPLLRASRVEIEEFLKKRCKKAGT